MKESLCYDFESKQAMPFFFYFGVFTIVSSVITLKKFYPHPHLGGEFY